MYLVATSRFNASAAVILEYLNQIKLVITDFIGSFTEKQIRENFILLYEVLNEMIDFGYPQLTTSSEILQKVASRCTNNTKFEINAPNFFKKDSIKVSATKESIHNSDSKNSIFIDIIENLWVTFNSSNKVI